MDSLVVLVVFGITYYYYSWHKSRLPYTTQKPRVNWAFSNQIFSMFVLAWLWMALGTKMYEMSISITLQWNKSKPTPCGCGSWVLLRFYLWHCCCYQSTLFVRKQNIYVNYVVALLYTKPYEDKTYSGQYLLNVFVYVIDTEHNLSCVLKYNSSEMRITSLIP